MRIGTGYDVHRFIENRPLMIGGIQIAFEKGLDGHSDADVLCHAIADAILGAASLGDIGIHFPDKDDRFRNMSGKEILKRTAIIACEWQIINIDSTVIAQAPKLSPYFSAMKEAIAEALGTEADRISVKATTEEKMGFTGRGEGIAAQAVCLIEKRK